MARYQNVVISKRGAAEVEAIAENFLTAEGFKKVPYGGETVWKKGQGWVAAPQFIKLEANGNQITVTAWLKFALLPGIYVGEMGTTGFFGFAIKQALRKRVARFESLLG
jgi:hypothetical protein